VAEAHQPYLRLAGVRKDFGSFTALKGVDLDIAQGEFVCFLGPSGCGKTTLLRIIAGLEVQSAGRIELAGRDISTLPPAERDYGIVFQSYALFPNLSVADNVAYGLVNRKVPRAQAQARVSELLALVGLPGSGSARQRSQVPGPALGWPAAAHRTGASPGHLAGAAAAGRAAVGAGCHRARQIAQRDPQPAAPAGRDHHHGHARPGGGLRGGRPHRGDEPRRDRTGGHGDGGLPRPGHALRGGLRGPHQFVGRINALPARAEGGGLRVGQQWLRCEHASVHGHAGDRELRVYLRPEGCAGAAHRAG